MNGTPTTASSVTYSKPRILFIDDHKMILDALSYVAQQDYEVQAVDTLAALKENVEQFHPNVVVLDIRMPDGDGIQAAKELLQQYPSLKVLFLSMHNQSQIVRRAMETGAVGFVSKRAPADELMLAIRTVMHGGRYIGANANSNGSDGAGLTERQTEVLRLIAQGCSAKEIATKLNISVRTAEFHRAAIMERLKLHSTAQMTRYAVEQGLD